MTDPNMLIVGAKYSLVLPLSYFLSVVPSKLAILSLYLSIFSMQKVTRIICYGTAGIIVANWLGATIAELLSCKPLNYFWDKTLPDGHCFDINAWYRWSSLNNIITDVIMLVLPIPHILRLHMSTRLKLGVSTTFLLGSL